MRFRFVIAPAGAIAIALVSACSSGTDNTLPTDTRLAIGDHAQIPDSPWAVQVDSLVSDSRCPADVYCIQAGDAVFAFALTSPLADGHPPDNPHFTLGHTPVTSEGFRFTLVDVTPVRHSNQGIPVASYRLTLRVEKLGGN